MTIQYASDLHLEFADNRAFVKNGGILPAGDVLVLAGDISYLGDKNLSEQSFFDWCASNYSQTLIVPGNHEFYKGYDIAQTIKDFDFECRPNVRYLNNKSIVIGDTELFFTTLWTRINPINLYAIERGMNDFRCCIFNGKRFCANDVNSLHETSVNWLQQALESSSAAHKIVVTHHCPTMQPQFNGYPGSALNSAFQVNLDSLIEASSADYWIYGHTHYAGGSGETIGKTKLLCNQMGYVSFGEDKAFKTDAILKL